MDKIKPNKNNKFSKEELEELAQLIKLGGGIWQNLIVKPIDAEAFYAMN